MLWKERMYRTLSIVTVLSLFACATGSPPPKPPPSKPTAAAELQVAELERRAAQLELQLMERDSVIDSLNARLDEALQEVVGAMGKLQSLTSRAEAASAMAEADVALQSITSSGRDSPESRQGLRLMQLSAGEFKRKNFGGALYLANQAKAAARAHLLAGGRLGNMRSGETPFAVPVKLHVSARANVRNGPGTNFAVSFTAEPSSTLSGLSYLGDWIRVTNDAGNEGWILRSLVLRRADTSR
jgi:uncharacterized coiled-coil protein SlyX